MSRPLRVETAVPGDREAIAAAFRDEPQRWLPEPARRAGPERWTVALRAGPVRRRVSCRIGATWDHGEVLGRTVSWEPSADPDVLLEEDALPLMVGSLGLHLAEPARLTLEGRYDVPGGRLGELADRVLLRHVARWTARAFLAEASARLAREAAPVGPRRA